METLQNYIKIFDLPLGDNVCKELIEEFEKNKEEEIKLDGHKFYSNHCYIPTITWKSKLDWLNHVFKANQFFMLKKLVLLEKISTTICI